MKLRAQPPLPRRSSKGPKRSARPARARGRGSSGQATRPGTPMRRRVVASLPSFRRILAVTGAVAGAAVLVALLSGPWLRVTQIAWAGERHTDPTDLAHLLAPGEGVSALAVDTGALEASLETLPAVAEAHVTVGLEGRIEATIVEHAAAFVWQTSSARFIGAADGTLFSMAALTDAPAPEAAGLPWITDRRFDSRLIVVGDTIEPALLRIGLQLAELDPARLGSQATDVAIRLDDRHGYRLASVSEGWEIALGMYGVDPRETDAEADARLERQITAVRTLFAAEPESGIAWVDVRNPGKVYFRAKG